MNYLKRNKVLLFLIFICVVLGLLGEYGNKKYLVFVFLVLAIILVFALMYSFTQDHTFILKEQLKERNMQKDYHSFTSLDEWKEFALHEEIEDILEGLSSEYDDLQDLEKYDRQTTLQVLQSQIHPHFLYNTLECIRGQALIDGDKEIADILEALGDFFRYSISRNENVVPLMDEIVNIKRYMFIQNYRFAGRYTLEVYYIEEENELENCLVPKLLLQPIIENSLLHAFENQEKGTITIEIDSDEKNLMITISDNGIGMDERTLKELNDHILGKTERVQKVSKTKGNGIALENVNKRIGILFGKEYGLHVYSTENVGTDVSVFLPRIMKISE